ncbi:YebY family protein [Scandinavium manionii]|uniref:YebY family protein n=1 Tax=Scandinavium manionii TaxID=2926520 RepID=UPI0021654B4B|nr:YebY family protein [Scandinavium manionii]
MKHKLLVALSALFISATASAMPFQAIEKGSFNGVWPFNTDEVQLQCLDGNAYVMNFDDNKLYALTGSARVSGRSFGALPLDNDNSFWLSVEKTKGLKKSLSDVTNAALALCGK